MRKLNRNFYEGDTVEVAKKLLGKLCRALNITKDNYGDDLTGDRLLIADDGYDSIDIASSKRINIDYAEEVKEFKWRFFIKGNPYGSK